MAQAALTRSSHSTFVCRAAQEVSKGQTRGHQLRGDFSFAEKYKKLELQARKVPVLTIQAKKT